MAKKSNNGEGAGKSKKRTVTPSAKRVAKPRQIKSTASRKPAGPFLVKGRVLMTDGPLAGALVRAVDQDRRGENPLGEASTDQEGNYQIIYSEIQFRRSEKEIGGPDLIVRVYSAEGKVMTQSKRKSNAKQEETVDLTVSNEQQFVVSGTVRRSDGKPAAGALVRAYDQDLRKKQLLGKATTDATGHYSIAYTSRKFLRAEKTGADLYVVVVNAQRKELVSSEVLFNAPVEVTVDLTLPPDGQTLSEYEFLLADILPLLKGQGKDDADLNIAELEDKDIAFLSRESGQPQERIAFLLAAVKAELATPSSSGMKVKSHVSTSQGPAIPVEAFYGWFRQGLPTDLNELLNQSDDVLRRALVASLRANIIPAALGDALDSILAHLQQLAAERLLKPGEPDGKASLGDLLSTVLPDPQKQRTLASLFVSHQGTGEAFWEALRGTPGFGKAKIGQIQTTLQFGALTGDHLPLVVELQRMGQQDPGLKELYGFARLDVADWENVLRRPQANGQPIGFPADVQGQDDSAKIANYAEKLNHYIESMFPTAVIARRLEKDNQVASPLMQVKDDLKTFFANNPAFEFGTTPVNLYLSQDRQQRLKGIKQPEELTVQLKNIQRLFKITPYFEKIDALLKDNLHSSQAIVHMGKREFVEKHARTFGGEEPAMIAYTLAEHIHFMALTLYARHSIAFNSPVPYVIAGDPVERMTRRSLIPSSSPDWRELFGSLDLCDCEDCRSLYSPSAYLVDILKFLKDGPKKDDQTPLQVLLDRRPDIANTELTCKNTNTPLPYVDLVDEVLENAVSLSSFSVVIPSPGGIVFFGDLNSEILPASLKNDFTSRGLSLSNSASVAVDEKDKKWTIRDSGWRYTLSYASGLFSVSAWPQTGGTDEELNANPEHTNVKAYDQLRQAVYPWSLPLNLWVEEAWVYLNHLGVQRHEMMETPFKGTPSAALTNNDIAREYLGLTKTEAGIITGAITHDLQPVIGVLSDRPWDFWGLLPSGNDLVDPADGTAPHVKGVWYTVLEHVSVFLQQSGLSYKELLEVLGTYFVNPLRYDGKRMFSLVAIETDEKGNPVDPGTCELSKLRIVDLDVAVLKRLHRFVRLWRKLGWAMRDLDKVHTALNLAGLSDDFLTQLSHIQRLRLETGLPVVNLLGWFADIDTSSYIDHLAEGQPEVASLYQQLFRNKTVINPLDEAFTEDANGLSGNLSGHLPALVAALGISAADLSLLTTGTAAVVTDDNLNLANLSNLYRVASFTKSLKLSIHEYLSIRKLSGIDPFTAIPATGMEPPIPPTGAALRFVETVDLIRVSGFSINELDYLLRHDFTPSSGVTPSEDAIAATLDEIRSELPKISAENTVREEPDDPSGMTTDPGGELTRKKLALLNWDTALIEQVVATLNGSVTYEAMTDTFLTGLVLPNDTGTYEVILDSLPIGFTFPSELTGVVTSVPKFLFACDSGIKIESSAGKISTELNNKFIENSVDLPINPTVTTETPGIAWKINGQYSVVKSGGILSIYDLKDLRLRASRLLSNHERDMLRDVTAGSNEYGMAIESLFILQDKLQGRSTYDQVTVNGQTKGRLRFTGLMTNARKAMLDSVSTVQDYLDAVQELYNASRKFIRRYMRTFSVQDFAIDLAALPSIVKFPNALKSKVYFDAASEPKQLHFIGAMTEQERDILRDLSTITADPNHVLYQHAVQILFVRSNADFGADLAGLPVSVKFPNTLNDKAYFDNTSNPKQLHFIGAMTEQERDMLLDLSTHTTDLNHAQYQNDVLDMFTRSNAFVTESSDIFLTVNGQDNDITAMLNNPTIPEDRFLRVLRKLIPYLRQTLSERLVAQKMAEALKLEAKTARDLLTKWVNSPIHSTKKSITEFLALDFAESNLNVNLTAAAFPDQFKTFTLLHKIAMLVVKYKLTPGQLTWLFDYGPGAGWLDLNALPLAPMAPTSSTSVLFAGWERLVDLFRLRDQLPLGESVLADVFSMARDATLTKEIVLLQKLSDHTGWSLEDLQVLVCVDGFDYPFPDAYRDERALVRLQACFKLIKRLGASAMQLTEWGKLEQTTAEELDNARSIKNAVKAKYDGGQWLTIAKPLKDQLREKQRAALVAYLVARDHLRDANELYEYFLIDVEMSPCMMTTRLKQAISSVQLFIQRCLMNLETDVSLNPEEAKEWHEWRKQYRVWEANRKVFLYPENWIEPELRDDKSPFFKDMENELMQNDVTTDTAETAFLHYLEKLDEVARLDIVGMYREQEAEDKNTETPAIDRLHVFGRTFATPHVYYYRKQEQSVWSAWEKVDLDIEGDHLIPVVWNRRIHLFWPIITEKTQKQTQTERITNDDPVEYWEIKLAWSEYKNGKWNPKKFSSELQEPLKQYMLANKSKGQTLTFKVRVDEDKLTINCFGAQEIANPTLSTSQLIVYPGDGEYPFPNASSWTTIYGFVYDTSDVNKKPIESATVRIRGTKVTYVTIGYDVIAKLREDTSVITDAKGSYIFTVQCDDEYEIGASVNSTYYDPSYISKKLTPNKNYSYNRDFPFQKKTTDTPTKTEKVPDRPVEMVSIGRFMFGSNETTRLELGVGAASPTLPVGTHIDSMQFVENSGEHTFANPDPAGMGVDILQGTPGTFRILAPHQDVQFSLRSPYFYQDDQRTYFASPSPEGMWFAIFFHPHVGSFIKALNRESILGLLTLRNQQLDDEGNTFWSKYYPVPLYFSDPSIIPKEDVDFGYQGAYSLYNWELFFHIPFLIATRLSKNQRFEDAQKWFHYILDPTSSESGGRERFWKVKPLYEEAMKKIQTLEELMDEGKALEDQVKQWSENPFKPHVIARLRLVAYMKAVVMKYIDNLIAWGDQLFRRDTIESINEATQLFVLAAQILGRRPEEIPARAIPETQTFTSLISGPGGIDAFGNKMVEIENFIFPSAPPTAPSPGTNSLGKMFFFCIPKNDKLLGYWDTVADRLFKIRHCMNIEGVERSLPMFEPKIDTGLLVRAAAAGVDISSALNDINAALPHYRFNVMLQKATELCNDVKALGAALLSALEKKDAEELALIRSRQEIKVLEAIREVKKKQIEDAKATLEGLNKAKELANTRYEYYKSVAFMNPGEKTHLDLLSQGLTLQAAQAGIDLMGNIMSLIPDLKGGAPTEMGATFGGTQLGGALKAFSAFIGSKISILNTTGSLSATLGGYQRRWDDWKLQEKLAATEMAQIDKQILAAEIRHAIAEKELENHELQRENAEEIEAYMKDKFTNKELYNWMVGQLSGIYFQSYQMAYDISKRAERAYRHELGLSDSNFVQFGYWDSLKKGLLAGEKLHFDLKRMDVVYLDQNKREYEITKHISLSQIDPLALVKLKSTGACEISLPELLFDMDYPGHYLRRIKSVGLTIPCVTGPYTGVNCTLTLLKSSIRQQSDLAGSSYQRDSNSDDNRFADTYGAIQSIVTSGAQNDTGLFEPNLRDERYLPFEFAGVISDWRLELPQDFNYFDVDTISDVVFHLRYTAREGGETLRNSVASFVRGALPTQGVQVFDLRRQFASVWQQFIQPATPSGVQELKLNLQSDLFPFYVRNRTVKIKEVYLFAEMNKENQDDYTVKFIKPSLSDLALSRTGLYGELHSAKYTAPDTSLPDIGEWTIQIRKQGALDYKSLEPDEIKNLVMVISFETE